MQVSFLNCVVWAIVWNHNLPITGSTVLKLIQMVNYTSTGTADLKDKTRMPRINNVGGEGEKKVTPCA